MKKSVIFAVSIVIIIALVLASIVSAAYICSDGSEIVRDTKEIRELDRKGINGIGIAVFKTDEFSALKGISVQLIIDAKKVSLSNESISEKIEISGTDYTVTLVNASDSKAKIKIDSSSGEIITDEIKTIGGLKVILSEASGIDIATMKAEIIVGSKELSLASAGVLSQVVEIENKDYLVELSSASDTDATIAVSKCKTGNLTEEVEVEEEVSESNITSEVNESAEQINATSNETINDSLEETNNAVNETKKELGEACEKADDCVSGKCKEEKCVKLGFFTRLINWFKNLFK